MTRRTAARTQLDPDWQPSAEDWKAVGTVLSGRGLAPIVEFEKFKDYHLAHGSLMASWSRAFRYWCRRAVEFAPQKAPGASQERPNMTPEHRAWLKGWYEQNGMHIPMKLRD